MRNPKIYFIIIFIFNCPIVFGQLIENKIETDSSIITIKHNKLDSYIQEFNELKDKTKWYYREFDTVNKFLIEESGFNNSQRKRELIFYKKYSNKNGKLINHLINTKGLWYVDKEEYPHFELQNKIRLKADSLLISVYGKYFFENNICIDIENSYVYNEFESDNWFYSLKDVPTEFLLSYYVLLENRYYDVINLRFDKVGNYITFDENIESYGFEEIDLLKNKTFEISRDTCLNYLNNIGYDIVDQAKLNYFLTWESFNDKKSFYNGRFLYYLIYEVRQEENIVEKRRSSRTKFFDVFVFNPWNSKFIELKKMKSIYSWNENSGYDTGLIEDK